MRCYASQTTCIAEAPRRPAAAAVPGEAALFATVLLKATLRPLAQPLGFFGDVAIDAFARALARRPQFERLFAPAMPDARR
ncbi:MAG: hypothetical protein JO359_00910 [Candidatus Eremiobacteraeota bacterium]|nr:hypothetical protein [Candidatus Eremiobacteraeota bacterium]